MDEKNPTFQPRKPRYRIKTKNSNVVACGVFDMRLKMLNLYVENSCHLSVY